MHGHMHLQAYVHTYVHPMNMLKYISGGGCAAGAIFFFPFSMNIRFFKRMYRYWGVAAPQARFFFFPLENLYIHFFFFGGGGGGGGGTSPPLGGSPPPMVASPLRNHILISDSESIA